MKNIKEENTKKPKNQTEDNEKEGRLRNKNKRGKKEE